MCEWSTARCCQVGSTAFELPGAVMEEHDNGGDDNALNGDEVHDDNNSD